MSDEIAKHLLTTLDGYNSPAAEKEAARKALIAMGAAAVAPILDFIENDHKLFGEVELLVEIGRPAVAPILTKLGVCSWYTFMRSAEALGKIRDASAVEPLVGFLKTRDWEHAKQRAYAADALGQIGDTKAIPPLVAVLEVGDHNDSTGVRAAKALGQIGDSSAIEPLLRVFRKGKLTSGSVRPDEIVHQRMVPAAWSLAMLGVPEVEDSIKQMIAHAGDAYSLPYVSTDEAQDLREALDVLRRKSLPATVAAQVQRKELLDGIRSMDVGKRKAACYQSATVGGTEIVKALIEALEHDPGPQYNKAEDLFQSSRKGAAFGLGKLADPLSVPVLSRCLKNDSPWEVKDGKAVERRDNPRRHELGMPVFGTSVREGLEEAGTEFARAILAQTVSVAATLPSPTNVVRSAGVPTAPNVRATTTNVKPANRAEAVTTTCPTCKGARRVKRNLPREWWQVLLFRPSAVNELCSSCSGTGLIKSKAEKQENNPPKNVLQGAKTAQNAAPTRPPQEKALCVIDLALPSTLTWRPNSLDEVLQMCAVYCWNPVDRKYNFDEAHRYTVQRSGQITLCTDPNGPAIRFQLDISTELAMEVTSFMRATWQELMSDMGQWGVNHFLESYRSRQR